MQKFEEDLKLGKAPNYVDSDDDNLKAARKQKVKSKKYTDLKKKKRQKPKGLSKVNRKKLDKRQKKVAQKRAKAVEHMLRRVISASGVPRNSLLSPTCVKEVDKTQGFEVSLISQKKKSSAAAKGSVNSFTVEVGSNMKKKRRNIEKINKAGSKHCFDVSTLNLKTNEGSETSYVEKNGTAHFNPEIEKQSKTKNDKIIKKDHEESLKIEEKVNAQTKSTQQSNKPETEQENNKPLHKSKRKLKAMRNIVDQKNVLPSSVKTAQGTEVGVIKDSVPSKESNGDNISEGMMQKSQSSRPLKTKSPWDEPLRNGEYEILIESKRRIPKSKKKINPIKVSISR